MIILISNDDGINSEGIKCLENTLRDLGEVWTVAPDRAQKRNEPSPDSCHAFKSHSAVK